MWFSPSILLSAPFLICLLSNTTTLLLCPEETSRATIVAQTLVQLTPSHPEIIKVMSTILKQYPEAGEAPWDYDHDPWLSPLTLAARAGNVELIQCLIKHSGPYLNMSRVDWMYGRSPLHEACLGDHYVAVQHLLIDGADPRVVDKEGLTPVMQAVELGHLHSLNILLHHRSLDAVTLEKRDHQHGFTALHTACTISEEKEGSKLVKALLDAGAGAITSFVGRSSSSNSSSDDEEEGMVVEYPLQGYLPIHVATAYGSIAAIKTLLTEGKVPIDQKTMEANQWSPLHVAVKWNQTEAADVLIKEGADLRAKDAEEKTAAMLAVTLGHLPFVQLLFDLLPEQIHDQSDRGFTALDLATLSGYLFIVDFLLRIGGDPTLRIGSQVKEVAQAKREKYYGWNAQGLAAMQGNIEMLRRLCQGHQVDIPLDGWLALSTSSSNEVLNLAYELLRASDVVDRSLAQFLVATRGTTGQRVPGIDETTTLTGFPVVTALHIAATEGQLETVKALLRWGADQSIRVGAGGFRRPHGLFLPEGSTAIYLAYDFGYEEVVEWLEGWDGGPKGWRRPEPQQDGGRGGGGEVARHRQRSRHKAQQQEQQQRQREEEDHRREKQQQQQQQRRREEEERHRQQSLELAKRKAEEKRRKKDDESKQQPRQQIQKEEEKRRDGAKVVKQAFTEGILTETLAQTTGASSSPELIEKVHQIVSDQSSKKEVERVQEDSQEVELTGLTAALFITAMFVIALFVVVSCVRSVGKGVVFLFYRLRMMIGDGAIYYLGLDLEARQYDGIYGHVARLAREGGASSSVVVVGGAAGVVPEGPAAIGGEGGPTEVARSEGKRSEAVEREKEAAAEEGKGEESVDDAAAGEGVGEKGRAEVVRLEGPPVESKEAEVGRKREAAAEEGKGEETANEVLGGEGREVVDDVHHPSSPVGPSTINIFRSLFFDTSDVDKLQQQQGSESDEKAHLIRGVQSPSLLVNDVAEQGEEGHLGDVSTATSLSIEKEAMAGEDAAAVSAHPMFGGVVPLSSSLTAAAEGAEEEQAMMQEEAESGSNLSSRLAVSSHEDDDGIAGDAEDNTSSAGVHTSATAAAAEEEVPFEDVASSSSSLMGESSATLEESEKRPSSSISPHESIENSSVDLHTAADEDEGEEKEGEEDVASSSSATVESSTTVETEKTPSSSISSHESMENPPVDLVTANEEEEEGEEEIDSSSSLSLEVAGAPLDTVPVEEEDVAEPSSSSANVSSLMEAHAAADVILDSVMGGESAEGKEEENAEGEGEESSLPPSSTLFPLAEPPVVAATKAVEKEEEGEQQKEPAVIETPSEKSVDDVALAEVPQEESVDTVAIIAAVRGEGEEKNESLVIETPSHKTVDDVRSAEVPQEGSVDLLAATTTAKKEREEDKEPVVVMAPPKKSANDEIPSAGVPQKESVDVMGEDNKYRSAALVSPSTSLPGTPKNDFSPSSATTTTTTAGGVALPIFVSAATTTNSNSPPPTENAVMDETKEKEREEGGGSMVKAPQQGKEKQDEEEEHKEPEKTLSAPSLEEEGVKGSPISQVKQHTPSSPAMIDTGEGGRKEGQTLSLALNEGKGGSPASQLSFSSSPSSLSTTSVSSSCSSMTNGSRQHRRRMSPLKRPINVPVSRNLWIDCRRVMLARDDDEEEEEEEGDLGDEGEQKEQEAIVDVCLGNEAMAPRLDEGEKTAGADEEVGGAVGERESESSGVEKRKETGVDFRDEREKEVIADSDLGKQEIVAVAGKLGKGEQQESGGVEGRRGRKMDALEETEGKGSSEVEGRRGKETGLADEGEKQEATRGVEGEKKDWFDDYW